MTARSGRTDPSLDDIERIALDTVEALPEAFRQSARKVLLRVAELAPREILDEMGIDDPYDLSGLYHGIPMTHRSVSFPAAEPEVIWLFRGAILREWHERGDVSFERIVTHVMVHELAHHFGWSDADIAAIDRWWE